MLKLFETTTIKSLTIKNRFVRSATWMGMADQDGACTPELVDHMVELARENVGLIISGFAYVTRQGMLDLLAPQQLGIHNDSLLPGLSAMTDAVHNAGGKIVVQMVHGGLFSNFKRSGSEVVGPSVLTAGKDPAGRAMTREEIQETSMLSEQRQSGLKSRIRRNSDPCRSRFPLESVSFPVLQ